MSYLKIESLVIRSTIDNNKFSLQEQFSCLHKVNSPQYEVVFENVLFNRTSVCQVTGNPSVDIQS